MNPKPLEKETDFFTSKSFTAPIPSTPSPQPLPPPPLPPPISVPNLKAVTLPLMSTSAKPQLSSMILMTKIASHHRAHVPLNACKSIQPPRPSRKASVSSARDAGIVPRPSHTSDLKTLYPNGYPARRLYRVCGLSLVDAVSVCSD